MSISEACADLRGRLARSALAPGDTRPAAEDDETRLVDLIAELERLKAAAAALQARSAVQLEAAVRRREAAAGVGARRQGRGVAAQLGLARRESPHRAQTLLGLAHDLTKELPHTLTALAEGRLSEHRAMLVDRETGCLDAADRARLDREVCGDPETLEGLGTRALVGELRRRAYAADPTAAVRRARRAETERCVTVRPAPDAMAYVTGLVPMARGVAVVAALSRAADSARSAGDPRGRGHLMADLFVERLTGQSSAEAVPLTVDLIVSDATLLGAGPEPAVLTDGGADGGAIPAQIARELVATSLDADATWLRRLYTDPGGRLLATTSTARFAPDGLAALLRVRDQGICRTPWCDAPARHWDHVVDHDSGGPTSVDNVQGLCEACNHAKQALGWRHRPAPPGESDRGHAVEITTPTGHRHRSRAPAPPQAARADDPPRQSRVEIYFTQRLVDWAA